MKKFLLLIIILLLILVAGIYFGYIDINPSDNVAENESETTETLVFESMPVSLVGEPIVVEDDEEVTVETMFGQSVVKLAVDKDEDSNGVSVDIYGFSTEAPDVSGSTGGGDSESCFDSCGTFCDESADECQIECDRTQAEVCDNADVRLAVCNTGCSLIPPPFNIPCFDHCEDDFDDACSENRLAECKDECKDTRGQMCDDACSDTCAI